MDVSQGLSPKKATAPAAGPLSTELERPEAIPYFLWDEPMSVAELKQRLVTASPPEKARLLGKILREARDTDVWRFTSVQEVVELWPELTRHLGRRRPFWEFLLDGWRRQGLLGGAR
ncbi:MAG: hypothetical protein QG573_1756 [Acidobacteriota bacterium]|nr:hypothetical protein [Acidobacteriota bacterium]